MHTSESSTVHRPPLPPSTTSLRLGLRLIRGLSERDARRIEGARRPFASFDDFVRQTGLGSGVLKKLAQADAFRSLQLDRRKALWQALPDDAPMPLFDALDRDDPPGTLPKMPPLQEVLADYGAAGVTLRQHPMAFLRAMLDAQEVVPAARLATTDHGRWLKVAGVVLLRQRPGTANGITFVTLEDETGMVNLIVRKDVWERCRRAARTASVMLVHGRLQKADGVIHVLAAKIEDLSAAFAHLNVQPRNFR